MRRRAYKKERMGRFSSGCLCRHVKAAEKFVFSLFSSSSTFFFWDVFSLVGACNVTARPLVFGNVLFLNLTARDHTFNGFSRGKKKCRAVEKRGLFRVHLNRNVSSTDKRE